MAMSKLSVGSFIGAKGFTKGRKKKINNSKLVRIPLRQMQYHMCGLENDQAAKGGKKIKRRYFISNLKKSSTL